MTEPLVVAFYLPQFHPIPENDMWWGPGFTEWTNTAAARPMFRGHHQPNLPGELGFYDLRCAETRLDQAQLARDHGVSAFAYWHYWFDGRLLLNDPLERVLNLGEPDLPFCIAWANHSWSTSTWSAIPPRRGAEVIQQTYPGEQDHRRHFEYLAPFLADPRYLRVDGRRLIFIHQPLLIPNLQNVVSLWRSMARAAGIGELLVVGEAWEHNAQPTGVDRTARFHRPTALPARAGPIARLRRRVCGLPIIRSWTDLAQRALDLRDGEWPILLPNWDTTPRRGRSGTVLTGTSPPAFEQLMRHAVLRARSSADAEVIFIKSWNEWAEGNHLEPDRRYGRAWLEAIKAALR